MHISTLWSYYLWIIHDILTRSDNISDTSARTGSSVVCMYPPVTGRVSISTLGQSGTLALYHTPAT